MRDLYANNQKILSTLLDSRHTFDFLQGWVNSIRNEILGLVSIAVGVVCLMKFQFQYLHYLSCVGGGDEFVSLTKAYQGDERVSIQEIKQELIKAIKVMRSKLGVNDTLSEILSNARLALMDKENSSL